jgi:inosine-uridine nucleoside N-ribohydrolase
VCSSDLTHAGSGLQNVAAVLAAMGRGDVPVARGSDTPTAGDRAFPADWRTSADAAWGLQLSSAPFVDKTAVELLTSTVRNSDRPVTILALGPWTDIAETLSADPSLAASIARVHAMGGAVNVPGNVATESGDPAATKAEWNLWIDPQADDVVVRSGIPLTLVPLDATGKLPLTSGFYDRLAQDHAAAGADVVYELLTPNSYLLDNTFFWDQLATVAFSYPASAAFANAGSIGVRFDGAKCIDDHAGPLAPGVWAIAYQTTAAGSTAVVVMRLHDGAAWDQLLEYARTTADVTVPPPFTASLMRCSYLSFSSPRKPLTSFTSSRAQPSSRSSSVRCVSRITTP